MDNFLPGHGCTSIDMTRKEFEALMKESGLGQHYNKKIFYFITIVHSNNTYTFMVVTSLTITLTSQYSVRSDEMHGQ